MELLASGHQIQQVIGSVHEGQIHGKPLHTKSSMWQNCQQKDCCRFAFCPWSSCPLVWGIKAESLWMLVGSLAQAAIFTFTVYYLEQQIKTSRAAIPILQHTNPLIGLYPEGKDQGGNGCSNNILIAVQLHFNGLGAKLFIWHRPWSSGGLTSVQKDD